MVTVAVAISMLAATLVGFLGTGNTNALFKLFDGGAWLGNDAKGNIVHVNGLTGSVDAVVGFKDAAGNDIEVIQRDDGLWIHNKTTGELRKLSESTWRTEVQRLIGPDTDVVMGDGIGYLVQRPIGTVTPIDPTSLDPIGDPMQLNGPIDRAAIDGKGVLWATVPTAGQIVGITGAEVKAIHTIDGGAAQLILSIVGGRATVVNASARTASSVSPDGIGTGVALPSGIDGDLQVSLLLTSDQLWLSGSTGDVVGKIDLATKRADGFKLDRPSAELGPPVTNGSSVYVPDDASKELVVLDQSTGKVTGAVAFPTADSNPEIFVKDDLLWVNAPDGSKAVVIDASGKVINVDKYAADVPINVDDADQPPPQAPLPDKYDPSKNDTGGTDPQSVDPNTVDPSQPPPTCESPGAPGSVTATAGDGKAVVTWSRSAPNGCAVEEYQITTNGGRGGARSVGPDSATLEIDDLKNGDDYSFSVTARNAVGYGDDTESNTVTPDSNVPSAPSNVSANARTDRTTDGAIDVNWDAADPRGGGAVASYSVVCDNRSGGADSTAVQSPAGTTNATITGLTFGDRYTCTVRATNIQDRVGDDSDPSDEVTPIGLPAAVTNCQAAAGDGQASLSWQAAAGRGGAVTYEVTYSGGSDSVTTTSAGIPSLANGTSYTFTISPTNSAGSGTSCTTAPVTPYPPTLGPPSVSPIQGYSAIGISWSDVGAAAYWVYDSAGQSPVQLPGSTFQYTKDTHDCGPSSFYVVAIDGFGRTSAPSGTAVATKLNRPPVLQDATEGFANQYAASTGHATTPITHYRSLAKYASDPDGDPVTLYTVDYQSFGTADWKWNLTNPTGAYEITISPGHPDVTLTIKWRARDACGEWSAPATFNMSVVDVASQKYPV